MLTNIGENCMLFFPTHVHGDEHNIHRAIFFQYFMTPKINNSLRNLTAKKIKFKFMHILC